MAIFQDLPIELLHRIIELAVEDAIAVKNEKLRKSILVKLALVSKDFTLPSQVTLWKYIGIFDREYTKGLLESEIAVGKIVEELELALDSSHFFKLDLSNLKIFLNRLKEVDSLVLYTSEALSIFIKSNALLKIPSLKELKSLFINGYSSIKRNISFNKGCDLQLPSLQHLTIFNFTPKSDDFFSKIIEASSSTLTSLELTLTDFELYSSSKTLDSIKRHASRLIALRIINFSNQLPLENILPLCFSLKSFALNSKNSFDITISALNSLPLSSRVECLTIGMGKLLQPVRNKVQVSSLVGNEDFNSFITTLDLPQLRELKYLYLDIGCIPVQNRWKADVSSVRERIDFVEKLEKRGIKLNIGTEKQAKIWEEEKKQLEFRTREFRYGRKVNSSKVVKC